MILGVKIQNKETKQYMAKGGGWNNIGKVWSRLRDAKLAICPHYYGWHGGIDMKDLNSEFIIINEDGTQKRIPVALYFMDYFRREFKYGYKKDEIQKIIEQITQYCKENGIELEETKE